MTRGILFVGNFLSHARGHRHYCEDLANRIEATHWSVVRTSSVPGRARKVADMAITAWRRRADYDRAHIDLYSGSAFGWAELVAFELQRLHRPFVLTLHGGSLPEFARRWPRRVRRLLATAAAVTSPSAYLRDALATYARRVIEIIPNGLDLSRTPFVLRARPRRRLLWLRAFHAVYNPVMAIDVLAGLCRRDRDTTLTMVGPDRGDGTLAAVVERARDLGVSDRVEIVGPIPNADVPSYLSRADVFLNTTNADNTPVSVLEAMGAGMCVVSTAVGGIPYLVEANREALLVPPRDANAMTAAIERVFVEPELARTLSERGHERALAANWPNVTERWTRLFESMSHG